ncbi:hypothetical protein BpHYR1_014395 [Brachionus plicatilis]|uniref:HAT C-terminal dimerisation domain-containing protein n=1 Tax=Brachionus plicatilis TaxID=10195 RepID=A0A3M7R268_BRAPC|nr:hypothetical protein BpHYR1_014395 [Brachionus plicatilis]
MTYFWLNGQLDINVNSVPEQEISLPKSCLKARLKKHKIPFNMYNGIGSKWPVYINLISEFENVDSKRFSLEKWWIQNKTRLPKMFEYSSLILHIPSSTADQERALSKYKIILSDNRQNMSDKTIYIENFLYQNIKSHGLQEPLDQSENFDNDILPLEC